MLPRSAQTQRTSSTQKVRRSHETTVCLVVRVRSQSRSETAPSLFGGSFIAVQGPCPAHEPRARFQLRRLRGWYRQSVAAVAWELAAAVVVMAVVAAAFLGGAWRGQPNSVSLAARLRFRRCPASPPVLAAALLDGAWRCHPRSVFPSSTANRRRFAWRPPKIF